MCFPIALAIAHDRLDNHTVDFEPSKAEFGVSTLIKPIAFASSIEQKYSTAVHSHLGLHRLLFINSMTHHSNCYLQVQGPLICSGELGSEMET